jgi:hypothetical protein
MNRLLLMLLALSTAAFAGTATDVVEDPPVMSQPAGGDLTGTITPADKVAELSAVCRVTQKTYTPVSFDRSSGNFIFKDLPGDEHYELCVKTADGALFEGIDLSWYEDRMLRLAAVRRRQLGMPAERQRPFTQKDLDAILNYVVKLKDFSDTRRVLYIRGDGLRATMLVELMRAGEFYHSEEGNQVVWRVELWYFGYRHGGWERVANVEHVLRRERLTKDQWQKIFVSYYPELTGFIDAAGVGKPVEFRIPDKPDPARGRVSGTEPKRDTKPIIIGLTGEKSATVPAKE